MKVIKHCICFEGSFRNGTIRAAGAPKQIEIALQRHAVDQDVEEAAPRAPTTGLSRPDPAFRQVKD